MNSASGLLKPQIRIQNVVHILILTWKILFCPRELLSFHFISDPDPIPPKQKFWIQNNATGETKTRVNLARSKDYKGNCPFKGTALRDDESLKFVSLTVHDMIFVRIFPPSNGR
jgi:hypothetical protein